MIRAAGLVAFNIALTLGLLEVGGLALFWQESGGLFYGRPLSATTQQTADSPFARDEFRPVLHPYFGYVYTTRGGDRQSFGYHLNNHYFLQAKDYVSRHPDCCDFPYRKGSEDEFVIGIFGGSVASAVAVTAQTGDFLPKLLAKSPAFANRKVTVLSFAVGGHKQPQQLEILSYYLSLGQTFDAAINIDGFNEITAGSINAGQHFALSYPNAHIWSAVPKFLDSQAAAPNSASLIAAYHQLAARESLSAIAQCRLAVCYLWRKAESLWHGTRPPPAAASKSTSYFAIDPARQGEWSEAIADQWAQSILLMHAQLGALGIPFVEIIQPNVWYRPTPYTGKPRPANADHVEKGYAALLARVPLLQGRRIDVINATPMFNDRDDVYSDDCCHFTHAGNQEIARRVAEWITSQALPPRPLAP